MRNVRDAVKTVQREKADIKKWGKSQVNNLNLQFKKLEKEEQTKPKQGRK